MLIIIRKTLSQYKWHLMIMKESSSADLSHHCQPGDRSMEPYFSASRLESAPWSSLWPQGRGTSAAGWEAPLLPCSLFTTRFWCYRKRENHVFSPLGPEEDPLLRPCKGNELFSVNFFEMRDQALMQVQVPLNTFAAITHLSQHSTSALQ